MTTAVRKSERSAWDTVQYYADLIRKQAMSTPARLDVGRIADMAEQLDVLARDMLYQLRNVGHVNPRENPPLLIWGNPRGKGAVVLSKRVYDIAYRHVEDGQDYKHEFSAGTWLFTHDKAPDQVTLWQHDGKPLFGDF